jgi:hypothetical protein
MAREGETLVIKCAPAAMCDGFALIDDVVVAGPDEIVDTYDVTDPCTWSQQVDLEDPVTHHQKQLMGACWKADVAYPNDVHSKSNAEIEFTLITENDGECLVGRSDASGTSWRQMTVVKDFTAYSSTCNYMTPNSKITGVHVALVGGNTNDGIYLQSIMFTNALYPAKKVFCQMAEADRLKSDERLYIDGDAGGIPRFDIMACSMA